MGRAAGELFLQIFANLHLLCPFRNGSLTYRQCRMRHTGPKVYVPFDGRRFWALSDALNNQSTLVRIEPSNGPCLWRSEYNRHRDDILCILALVQQRFEHHLNWSIAVQCVVHHSIRDCWGVTSLLLNSSLISDSEWNQFLYAIDEWSRRTCYAWNKPIVISVNVIFFLQRLAYKYVKYLKSLEAIRVMDSGVKVTLLLHAASRTRIHFVNTLPDKISWQYANLKYKWTVQFPRTVSL